MEDIEIIEETEQQIFDFDSYYIELLNYEESKLELIENMVTTAYWGIGLMLGLVVIIVFIKSVFKNV